MAQHTVLGSADSVAISAAVPEAASAATLTAPVRRIVNDFSVQVATVNGSGSQSANNILLRSIFRMGVPVSGKNLFPSNIAGLPTWYTIRASKYGYVARKKEIDILIAMNAETAREDVLSLPSGGVVICEATSDLAQVRDDVIVYPVPFDKLTAQVCPEAGKEHDLCRRGGAVVVT
jgi:2-oxoglutarate ferredoxin oxidoreductase subunit alpha